MKMKIHTGTPRNVGGLLCTVRSKAAIHHRSKYWMPTKSRYILAALPILSSSLPRPLFLSDPILSYRARHLNVRCPVAYEPEIKRKAGRSVAAASVHRNYRDVERCDAATWEIDRLTYTTIARLIDWIGIRYAGVEIRALSRWFFIVLFFVFRQS